MTTTSLISLQRLYSVMVNVYDRFTIIHADLIVAKSTMFDTDSTNKELKKALQKAKRYDANLVSYYYILSDMLYQIGQSDLEYSLSERQREVLGSINYQVDSIFRNYINA